MSLSVADILARKYSLTPEQRAQLERRLRGEATPAAAGPGPIRRAARAPQPPLSYAQQRLWFLDQLEPGNPFYNVPRALRFEGRLDTRALREGFTEIARRHESLRTVFPATDGEPFQHVLAPCAVEVPLVDLSGLDAAAREVEARRIAEAEAVWRFGLGTGPLMRVVLVRLAPESHVLLLNMHHIVTDGWSMQVFVKELTALYDAYSRGGSSPLAEPSVQYADFSAWQAEQLQGERLEGLLGYWRGRLAGVPTTLELPTDRPRPAVQSHRGGTLPFFVGEEVAGALVRLSQAEGATLFMTLLAAFHALLHRYTGQRDILVGSPIANRGHAELEGLIGFFVNTLVLRANFERDETFRGLLKRTRETTLEAYAHQDLPFERLVEELQPQRDLSRTPLFQVMFVFQNVPGGGEAGLAGVRLAAQEVHATTAKFELTLTVTQTERGLAGAFEYNADLFDRATVERMAAHLSTLLAGAAADPDARLSELPLMADEERTLVLEGWNATGRARDENNCAHHMFERQAALTPDRTALVFEGETLTYAELDARANRLARHLRRLGVGPESRVAISLERSTAMVLAVLGVLKAGACYVPIDPSYPLERRSVMLGASGAQVLLTRRELSGELVAEGTRVLCWEDAEEPVARESDASLAAEVAGDNLAYVIYTSGSTGGPKGVALPHAALANLIEWHCDTLLAGAQTLQFASLSFDASFHEMFAAWATGGTLYLIAEFERMDVAALCDFIDRHRIEKVILPVVVLQELGSQKGEAAGTLTSLREVTSTGEQLKLTAAAVGLFERLEGCLLHNHYGPSESHVVTAYTFEGAPESWPALPPVGRPIYNTRIYVLDERLSPVPAGVHGELYIGGECLARGYLNRPATTAEKFIPDPFGRGGERLYRTGDVARYLADGQIEYLGRKDEQVKIRGFRVEPGEVEAALARHTAVAEAAVCTADDPAGGKRLVAYVVPDRAAGSSAPTARELRAHLKEHLPEYMIPSAFVTLETLPLTNNGKLDRRALPDPGDPHEGLGREHVAPSGEIEKGLAAVWEQVLGAGRVGAHDNFFELGGHSLKATQVLSRIRERFGDAVTLRDLFSTPTVRELAEKIAARAGAPDATAAVGGDEIERVGEKEFYATSSAQRRVWVVCQEPSASRAYNLPGSFLLEGELDAAALGRAFGGLVQRHESLRTTFAVVEGEVKQRIGDGGGIEIELLDLGFADDGAELPVSLVREAALREADQLFDLERGPLVRAKLAKVGPGTHLFLLTLHHIIADGWSLSLLGRELVQLYEAALEGREAALGELRIQYRDYAEWENSHLAGERLEAQASYWREKLGGELTPVNIGGDFEAAASDRYRGEVSAFDLDEALVETLRALGRENGASLYMILLTAVYVLLHRYTGQGDIVVACPTSGRSKRELEAVVGMFLNTLLLRTEVGGDDSLGRLLAKVRATTLEAFEHQDYPFDLLARELRVERRAGRPPLMEVVVTLQEEAGAGAGPSAAAQDGGLRVSEWGQWNGVSKNDLWFGFREDGRGLSGALNYDSDKFAAETIDGIVARLKEILARMAEGPDALVSELFAGAATRPVEESFGFDVAL